MFEYFYNEILRRTIIAFGTLFNGITVKQTNSDGSVVDDLRVPLAYGPTQKFLARLTQQPDLNKATAMTLPRMSFEFTGLTYDPSRKLTTTQQFIVKDPTTNKNSSKAYMPVPYNMQFELAVMCKLNDDALQIIEQILPYFQPSYNVTVNLVGSINEKRDIPIVLENITMQDDYEGDFETRRVLLYTLRFSAKTYMFGPVSAASDDIIRSVKVNYLTGKDTQNTRRDLTYSVVPRAIQAYTGDVTTLLSEDITATSDTVTVDAIGSLKALDYLDLEGEEVQIERVDGNSIVIKRGMDGTTATPHVKGSPVKYIDNTVEKEEIPLGDDFGFDGTIS